MGLSTNLQNEQEAWISIMYLVVSADGEFSDVESDVLSRMVIFNSFFEGHDTISMIKKAMSNKQIIGENRLLEAAAKLISEENKPTLLALSIDLMMADGLISNREQNLINTVARQMRMETTMSDKIVEVMMYKNKYNIPIIEDDDGNDIDYDDDDFDDYDD